MAMMVVMSRDNHGLTIGNRQKDVKHYRNCPHTQNSNACNAKHSLLGQKAC
jgi:hypothetical protein